MNILVTCELPEFALEQLRSLGSVVDYKPQLPPEQLRDAIPGISVLVVDSRRVSPETIARGDMLQMIVRAGAGPGDVAVEEASAQGVFVTHCPTQHAVAVAELTFGLLLALDRRILDMTEATHEGRWVRGKFKDARGLAGRTLGVLGYGAAGREVARRATAFGMKVLAWCPTLAAEAPHEPGITFCNWPRELARQSDFVTVHVPPGPEERIALVDTEFLESMRPGACLVHVGHPTAEEEAALADAVTRRGLRVALDAYGAAPTADSARYRCPLADLPGTIVTQHQGPLTEQAQHAIAAEVVRIARSFIVSGDITNCLNLLERSPATWQLVLRARDAVGVMASILEAVRADGINVEEISSRVFLGARAAWCTVALDERPSNEALEAIRSLDEVLYLELRAVV
ncbi:MAG: NAD(P)-dependent oxidoreductase [Phycisphaerae bacterium]|jgi:D-3-phosphoglycerate dehydrogenase